MRTMKRFVSTLLAGMAILGAAGQAQAQTPIQITLDPGQIVQVGNLASVDVLISGLGDFQPPSLGGFELYMTYDESVMLAESFTFGPDLDLGFGSDQFADLATPGLVVFEVAFATPQELDDNQPGAFRLGTISFRGLAEGVSAVGLDDGLLADALGDPLDFGFTGVTIQVIKKPPTGLPDGGSTFALLIPALAGMVVLRGKMRA